MCGIAGVFRFDQHVVPPSDLAALAEMATVQHHRGPDDSGLETYGRCALANQRLSILDVSPAGHMPMHDETGRLALIQNATLYNYLALFRYLRPLGNVFSSAAVTEIILR